MKSKYIHKEAVQNLFAPQEIVPEIMKLLQPRNVVDIGCGLGTFLYCFKEAGVNTVLGVDGPWTVIEAKRLEKILSGKLFFIHYLRLMLLSPFTYDYIKKFKKFFGHNE